MAQGTLGTRAASFWGAYKRPLLIATGCVAVLRVVTEVVGLLGRYGVDFPHVIGRDHSLLTTVWFQWDAGLYISIAAHGYPPGHVVAGHQNLIAFAPLYPWLMRALHDVTGLGYGNSGLIISLVAAAIGLVGVYKVVSLDSDPAVAGNTVTMMVAWPAAFFLVTGYADALAMAAVVWSFWAARRGSWLAAGILAAAAGATKYYAVVIVLALLVEWWEARRPIAPLLRGVQLAFLAGPSLLFFGIFMAYCAMHVGDPLAFVRAQAGWGRHFGWPWTLAAHSAQDLVHLRFLDTSHASVVELYDAVTVVMLVAAVPYAWLRMRHSYGVLLAAITCIYIFETVLISENREVLMFFPFFAVLGQLCERHRWLERALLACFIPAAYYLVERFVTMRFAG